jgi:hypothetical protein
VDITVARNTVSEKKTQNDFLNLQDAIYQSFGSSEPSTPILRCRNATQTSVVLEWDPITSATADVISLSLYRNGQKAGNIPKPTENSSTKISGLGVDSEYTFHLVLRTTAGTFTSEKVTVRTHKMTDLSGITITPGILPAQLRESLTKAVERIGAKMVDSVRIDTTHFVTTEARGLAWEKAVEQNVPVVRPEWVEGCERGGRIMGVRGYYLDADPRLRQVPQSAGLAQQPTQQPPTQVEVPKEEASGATEKEDESKKLPQEPPAEDEKQEGAEKNDEDDKTSDVEPTEEQKSRIEDRDEQKVVIPPTATDEELENEPEPEEEPESLKPQEEDEKDGSHTPGSAGFQDVAL